MKIAVDAMGGDFAPSVVIDGAYEASLLFKDIEIILVGNKDKIDEELKKRSWRLPDNISIHHCSEMIEMHESPVTALRKKKNSSVLVASDLVIKGQADSLVTAGNTGAAVAATTLRWRMLEGIDRPGIALPLPTIKGVTVLVDVGANIQCKPVHYLQYAIMGEVYSKYILKKQEVKIGLLNIGEEDTKGGDEMKEVFALLKATLPNFIGNVEGRDIYNGKCDVIVCDGFVGNIVLKVSEGLADALVTLTKNAIKSSLISMAGAMLAKPAFRKIKKDIDYSEYGGAPLLGVNGNCIISHGGSSAKAIKNAIRVSREFIKYNVNDKILKEIRKYNVSSKESL